MMKYIFTLLTLSLFLSSGFAQDWSQERTVKAQAITNANPASITLKWESSSYATAYNVYRRGLDSASWGSSIATLGANDSTFKDNDVVLNQVYEYRIVRTTSITEPLSSTGAKLEAYAFLVSGIKVEPTHHRGNMLILVNETLESSISTELDQLQLDLVGDGYEVEIVSVDDAATVTEVAAIITLKPHVEYIYLLGQVPYPYSGIYCRPGNYETPPDGHDENNGAHCGAWIADAYYGSLDANWTDEDSTTIASRTANDNLIGDGKFDNMQLPGKVNLQVGRVDLSRLSKFSESETELIKRYLNKAHDYKHYKTVYTEKAIIENNFASFPEGFSSAAIRDFYGHLGPGKTLYADLFTTTETEDYLFSYTCGAGSYTSCNGVGRTDSFVMNNPAAFNHMFGSYFGDYDVNNNISRASLAAQSGGLVSAWSGRPKWITHGLAMGENYGKSAIRSQNNDWGYDLSFYQNYAHISLIGDLSLRTSMIDPPKDIIVTNNMDSTHVYLNWTASSTSVNGYYIYWSQDQFSGYTLLTQAPVSQSNFNHYTPTNGTNYYMVRAERLEETASGSYYNLSQAAFATASGVKRTASINQITSKTLSIYPIPAEDRINIRMKSNEMKSAVIINALGEVIISDLSITNGSEIEVSGLTQGMYFLQTDGQNYRFIVL